MGLTPTLYTAHLKEFERSKPTGQVTPTWLQGVQTLQVLGEWEKVLATHSYHPEFRGVCAEEDPTGLQDWL